MTRGFAPKLNILPEAKKYLWQELDSLPRELVRYWHVKIGRFPAPKCRSGRLARREFVA